MKPGIAGGRIWSVRRPPYLPETRTCAGRSIAQLTALRRLTLANGRPDWVFSAHHVVTAVGLTQNCFLLTPYWSPSEAAAAAGTFGFRSDWPALICRTLW